MCDLLIGADQKSIAIVVYSCLDVWLFLHGFVGLLKIVGPLCSN